MGRPFRRLRWWWPGLDCEWKYTQMNRFKKYLSSSISGIYWLVACEDEQSKDIPIPFSGEEGPGIH